jgi:hypothetical protein
MTKSERGRLDQLLDEAAADAEAEPDAGVLIEPHVKVTRGGPRTRVLQVRLNDDELAAFEALAEARGLPASTVAREMILNALDPGPVQAAARLRLIGAFEHYIDMHPGTLPDSAVPLVAGLVAPKVRRAAERAGRPRSAAGRRRAK